MSAIKWTFETACEWLARGVGQSNLTEFKRR